MKRLLVVFLIFTLYSCNNDFDVLQPNIDPQGLLDETEILENESKVIMNGIYEVTEGNDLFGNAVVIKWNRDKLSLFSGNQGAYAVLRGGRLDSILYFEGYWRFPFNSSTGLLRIHISADSGGTSILEQDTADLKIIIEGVYGSGNEVPSTRLLLRHGRPLVLSPDEEEFEILAHRGGGRNSDYTGASENTVEILRLVEGFGATGVELDVRMSEDGMLFLYHDVDINLRLTQKGPLWGLIEEYSWAQIRSLITLVNGERIPSLSEALKFIVDSTLLRTVWLDIKNPNAVAKAAVIQEEMLLRAEANDRNLKIYIGLPEEAVVNRFKEIPSHQNIPSLCELGFPVIREINASVWAPRWTDGLQLDAVREMQNEERKVFVWTVDQPPFIESFITEGEFNGILTNYPSLTAFYHYFHSAGGE